MRKLTGMLLGLVALGVAVPAQAASLFYFSFDDQGIDTDLGDGPLLGPIVGTGTFSSPIDLAPGTYDLSALAGFTLDLSFIDGTVFTEADFDTPVTGVAVRITDLGGGAQRLFLTEGSGPGVTDGVFGGALDLLSDSAAASFQPTESGGNFFYFVGTEFTSFEGRYLATTSAIPEPASWALMLLGFAAVGGAARRARDRRWESIRHA